MPEDELIPYLHILYKPIRKSELLKQIPREILIELDRFWFIETRLWGRLLPDQSSGPRTDLGVGGWFIVSYGNNSAQAGTLEQILDSKKFKDDCEPEFRLSPNGAALLLKAPDRRVERTSRERYAEILNRIQTTGVPDGNGGFEVIDDLAMYFDLMPYEMITSKDVKGASYRSFVPEVNAQAHFADLCRLETSTRPDPSHKGMNLRIFSAKAIAWLRNAAGVEDGNVPPNDTDAAGTKGHEPPIDDGEPYFPPNAFNTFNVKTDTLGKAARNNRIRRKQVGNAHHYSLPDCHRLWPQLVPATKAEFLAKISPQPQ